MQGFESSDRLDKNFPDNFFFHECTTLLVLAYFLKYIPVVSVFHHNAIMSYKPKNKAYQSEDEGSSKKACL